jgi:SpoVK/Ycf46/Vps4 family AAA+-type ATPase
VAKALRSQVSSIGGAFISLKSSDIVRAEVGESEKLVVQAFHTARTNSPAVIFIDEFQALFTERSSGSSSRLTTTLLQCMDDLQRFGNYDSHSDDIVTDKSKNEARVLVLAATNTPWMIDRAFLRPGRFDRSVLVNLPNFDERVSILMLLVKRMKASINSATTVSLATFCTKLAHKTDGFSGADLASLCRAAAICCLLEKSESVLEKHFLVVLEDGLQASSSISLVRRNETWRP